MESVDAKPVVRSCNGAFVDLTGQRFGRLVVLEFAGSNEVGLAMWRCQCDCGNVCVKTGSNLKQGRTRSCGCLRREMASQDLLGKRFGKLVVTKRTDKRRNDSIIWECACDCGNVCEATTRILTSGDKRSCGCLVTGAKSKDLAGQRFGHLVAVKPDGRKNGYVLWECKCDCGNVRHARTYELTSGKATKCSKDCACARQG